MSDRKSRRKRIAAVLAAALTVAAAVAASAFGFFSNFDYFGHVKHDQELSSVGFKVNPTNSGQKRVARFTVTNVPITCSDSLDTRSSDGYEFAEAMRVRHGDFAGSGDWTVIALDPAGSVAGTLHPGGTATGTFRLHGELAGPTTHCHTGELHWKATKVA